MAKEAKTKFRTIKRKKRRGFYGRIPAEFQKEHNDRVSTCDLVPGPSCSSLQVHEDKEPLTASNPFKENVSLRKLHNSFCLFSSLSRQVIIFSFYMYYICCILDYLLNFPKDKLIVHVVKIFSGAYWIRHQ